METKDSKILNFKGLNYYITSDGKVFNKFFKPLKQHLDKDGYLRVRLTDITKNKIDKRVFKSVHRLVYKCFTINLDNFDNLTINHIDGNKTNNNLYNLELITRSENNKHAYKTGLKNNKGSKHGKSKFIESDIFKIREMYFSGNYNQSEIAILFNTKQSRISEIVTNKTWKHI